MVKHPPDYHWSSYACNAMGKLNTIFNAHVLYQQLDNTPESRQFNYREISNNHIDKEDLNSIRDALNHELVLGRDDFIEKLNK